MILSLKSKINSKQQKNKGKKANKYSYKITIKVSRDEEDGRQKGKNGESLHFFTQNFGANIDEKQKPHKKSTQWRNWKSASGFIPFRRLKIKKSLGLSINFIVQTKTTEKIAITLTVHPVFTLFI